jgi:hypothetical protein
LSSEGKIDVRASDIKTASEYDIADHALRSKITLLVTSVRDVGKSVDNIELH